MKLPFGVRTTASVPGATGGSFAAARAAFGAGFVAGACPRAGAADAVRPRTRTAPTLLLPLMADLRSQGAS